MIAVRAAAEADIPFIMATERKPGYEWVVGRWDDALHRAEMAKASTAYVVAERSDASLGFGMLQNLDDPAGNVLLKRIAVGEKGAGVGRAILGALLRIAFERPQPHRLWLTVAPQNAHARHLYESIGFQMEGVMREAHIGPDGKRFSPIVMSILRPEWEAGGA